MSTTYTHWYFGQQCLEQLPVDLQNLINKHRDLYDIGVHGPDIFFYDLKHPELKKYGDSLHYTSGKEIFTNMINVYNSNPNKEEMFAYIMGFFSHFILDSQVHGYVDRKKEVSGITHNKVESEYDGYLMRKTNKVGRIDRSRSLKPSLENAKVISQFFPYDQETIYRTIKGQKKIIKTLNCRTKTKYRLYTKILDMTKNDGFRDLPVNHGEAEICRDSNLRLEKLQANALKVYISLYNNLINAINNNEPLDDYFNHNFEKWDDYKDIPILTYQEELDYKI